MKLIIAMVEEDSDDSSEYSDDEDELGNKVSIAGYIPQKIIYSFLSNKHFKIRYKFVLEKQRKRFQRLG